MIKVVKALTAPFENTVFHFVAVYFDMTVMDSWRYMRNCTSPRQARAHDVRLVRPTLSAAAITHLRRKGYVVVDDALTDAEVTAARNDAEDLDGFGSTWQHGDAVRTDSILWWSEDGLGEQSPRLGLAVALRRLRGLASELVASPSTVEVEAGCSPKQSMEGGWDGFDVARHDVILGVPLVCQLARYEAQSPNGPPPRYHPHRDGLSPALVPRWSLRAFEKAGTSAREVSAILYLNRAGDFSGTNDTGSAGERQGNDQGGELMLYLSANDLDVTGNSAMKTLRVNPIGGRLVLFDSRRVLHEVLPHTAAAPRLALTCWFGGRYKSRCLETVFRSILRE